MRGKVSCFSIFISTFEIFFFPGFFTSRVKPQPSVRCANTNNEAADSLVELTAKVRLLGEKSFCSCNITAFFRLFRPINPMENTTFFLLFLCRSSKLIESSFPLFCQFSLRLVTSYPWLQVDIFNSMKFNRIETFVTEKMSWWKLVNIFFSHKWTYSLQQEEKHYKKNFSADKKI